LADLRGDGTLEILVKEVFLLHALGADGVDLAGWPVPTLFSGLVAAVDLDLDGGDEVIHLSGSSLVVHEVDGSVAPGWPQPLSGAGRRVFAVDVDADGGPEVLAEGSTGLVHSFRSDGTPLAGWPVNLGTVASTLGDADGDLDIELVSWVGREAHATNPDASGSTGWPLRVSGQVTVQGVFLGDVLGDGTLDVLVPGIAPPTQQGVLYLFDGAGAPSVSAWPLEHGDHRNSRRGVASQATDAPSPRPAPSRFSFLPARPNPAPGRIVFRWVQPHDANVRLRVFDVSGRMVATLLDERVSAGSHSVVWERPRVGVHFARLEAPPFSATQKTVTLR
jgi:hypothetical protein